MTTLACTECGTVLEDATNELKLAHGEIARLTQQIEEAERELRRYRSKVTRLENELAKQQEEDPSWLEAKGVFDYWIDHCGKRLSTEFDDSRRKAVLARLHGGEFTADDLKIAIDGAAQFPFMVDGERKTTGQPKQRFDDLELICRSSQNVQRFMNQSGRAAPAPSAHELHKVAVSDGPLYRAVGALRREWGMDTCTGEPRTAEDGWALLSLTFHSCCPLHPFPKVGLVLSAGDYNAHVDYRCEAACDPTEIKAEIDRMEHRQVERTKALENFDQYASPQTLDQVVKALALKGEKPNRYAIARTIGIHDSEQLGLLDDPREVQWAA